MQHRLTVGCGGSILLRGHPNILTRLLVQGRPAATSGCCCGTCEGDFLLDRSVRGLSAAVNGTDTISEETRK